ncbi:MAG: hypothetical protein JW741_19160 [Sedimentisphaerales bacterium]|nr:hypothetical protein [Sedimentisphaerales bacterium]
MIQGISQDLSEEQRRCVSQVLRKKVYSFAALLVLVVGGGLWGIYNNVKNRMEELVAQQFDEPRIQEITRDAAASRASVLMEEQIQPEVAKFKEEISEKNNEAGEKIASLEESLAAATSVLSRLTSTNRFMETVVAAQNDDRVAFDQLELWANDPSDECHDQSLAAWMAILEDNSAGPFFIPTDKLPWKEGYDPSQLNLDELRERYHKLPALLRPALINYIGKREDLNKLDRLDFMMEVMKSDPSLKVVRYAGYYFNKGTNQHIKPLAVSYLSEWWSEHRNEFVEASPKQEPAQQSRSTILIQDPNK